MSYGRIICRLNVTKWHEYITKYHVIIWPPRLKFTCQWSDVVHPQMLRQQKLRRRRLLQQTQMTRRRKHLPVLDRVSEACKDDARCGACEYEWTVLAEVSGTDDGSSDLLRTHDHTLHYLPEAVYWRNCYFRRKTIGVVLKIKSGWRCFARSMHRQR